MNVIAAGIVSLMTVTGGLPEVMWLGDPNPTGSAASFGMGNSEWLEASPLGALSNPSMLGLVGEGLRMELAGGAAFATEKRLRRVYDTFGSTIGEAEHAYNSGVAPYPGGAAVSLAGIPGFPEAVSFALGWRVPASFAYEYDRIIRDEAYVRVGDQDLSVSGSLNELDLSVAFSPERSLTFGVGGGLVIGSREVTWEEDYVDPTVEDVYGRRTEDVSGAVARGALLYAPSRRVHVSAGVEYPMPLSFSPSDTGTVSWSVLSDEDYDLEPPMRVDVGAVYVPGNQLMSRFVAGFHWSSDGGMENEGESLGLQNAWGVNAGVENTIPGGPLTRFGFSYRRSPLADDLDEMGFTAGMGFMAGCWNIDAALGFFPSRWNQVDVQGLPSFPSGDSLIVEESETRLVLSVGRTFGL